MKKSKADTAETRRRIVSTASQLFLDKGLGETGIADVMAAAKLTPGGFYRHFDSKDQLIAEASREANGTLFEYYDAAVAGMQPLQAIETIVRLYLWQLAGNDKILRCPLANLGSELRHSDDRIRAIAMEGYRQLSGSFTALATQLGVADPASVADAIVSTIVGAVTLSQLSVDLAIAENILKNAQATVGTLLRPLHPVTAGVAA